MNSCPLCNNNNFNVLYNIKDIPVLQNKVYDTERDAKEATKGNITLIICNNCAFIFNKDYDKNLLDYDANYNNEQTYSDYFKNYLDDIINMFKKQNLQKKKIVEIGCGKGYFLEKMVENGFDIMGFDPAYEGFNKNIIKDYFSEKYSHIDADLIILRHTLEHIQNPFDFLHIIAKANHYKGMIFIEVPTFDWINSNNAFWDICYEHCNYFTGDTLALMFEKCKIDKFFNGQYIYLFANLKDILFKEDIENNIKIKHSERIKKSNLLVTESLKRYRSFLEINNKIAIWGGAAKGVIFANLIDNKQEYIKYIIDINPKKQNKFIATTAHRIVAPDVIRNDKMLDTILVMNRNYLKEIKQIMGTSDKNKKYYCVEELT